MLFKKTNIMIFLILILFLLIIFIFYNKNNNTTNTINKNNDNFEVKPNNGNNIRFATDSQIINNKIKLVNKKDSLLQKMIRDDLEKDDKNVLTTLEHINDDDKKIANRRDGADNDDKYNGYNNFVNLRTDSYAPITSIGKQLITAFDDLPVAS
jgi:hypothetical protein